MEEKRSSHIALMDEILSLETRFDRHLEIYANNGIESRRVADILETMLARAAARDSKIDEMYSKFSEDAAVDKADTRRIQTVIMWGSAIAACVAIIAAAKFVLTI